MPKDRDSKRKKRQRKAAEKTSVARTGHDKNNIVSRQECVKPLAPELSTGRAVKIQRCRGQTESRESGIIRKGSRMKEVSRRKGF